MRIKDINEGPLQRGLARGFTRTQKGGALGPDSAERFIKGLFTNKKDDKKSKSDDKPKVTTKNTVVTKQPVDAKKPLDKGKPAPEPKAAEPKAAEPKAKDDFPTGIIKGGTYVKVKPGDVVVYTNAKGQTKDGEVTKLLDTRDKQGDLQIRLKKKGAEFAIDRANIIKVNGQDWKYSPEKGSDAGKTKENIMSKAMKEGLADLAGRAEADHEVQMARADLYKIAKYAIKLHDMLKGVDESQGLEGWQQAKITKAADYMGSVFHNLDYEMKFGEGMNEAKEEATCGCGPDCDHCGGKHTIAEVGKKCECCGNEVKAVAAEGKSPHKKGSAKYKKHMAAKHAAMGEDAYKSKMSERLAAKLEAQVTPPTKPAKIDAKDVKAKQIKPNKGNSGGGGGR